MRFARFADPTGDAPGQFIAHIADVGSILNASVDAADGVRYISSAGQARRRHYGWVITSGRRSLDGLVATTFAGDTFVASARGLRNYMRVIGQPWEQRVEMVDLLGVDREEAF